MGFGKGLCRGRPIRLCSTLFVSTYRLWERRGRERAHRLRDDSVPRDRFGISVVDTMTNHRERDRDLLNFQKTAQRNAAARRAATDRVMESVQRRTQAFKDHQRETGKGRPV